MTNIKNKEAKINIMSNSPLADGRCKLMLIFSYKGNRLRMDTGERCLPEHFDKIKQLVNKAHPFQQETNYILTKLCNDVVSEYKKNIVSATKSLFRLSIPILLSV